jgi:Zn-dependent peptidase ImmA (M78 family)
MLVGLGRAVREAREGRSWTTDLLAQRAEVPASAITTLEAGLSGVTTTQLGAIARALEVDERSLRAGLVVRRPTPSVYLRHQGLFPDFHDADTAVLDEAVEDARTLAELNAALATAPPPWKGMARNAPRDRDDAPAHDGYRLAGEVRKHLDMPSECIDDLRALVEERLGIPVLVRQMSTGDAFTVKAGEAAAIILRAKLTRRAVLDRVAIAHELCHALHDPTVDGVSVVLDRDNDRNADANERRARAYAAEFLLPKTGLQGVLGLPRRVAAFNEAVELTRHAMDHFGASWELTANHLCNRDFVSFALREELESAHEHPAPAWWPMTLPQAGTPSAFLIEQTRRAHDLALLTDGEARSILRLDASEFLPWQS